MRNINFTYTCCNELGYFISYCVRVSVLGNLEVHHLGCVDVKCLRQAKAAKPCHSSGLNTFTAQPRHARHADRGQTIRRIYETSLLRVHWSLTSGPWLNPARCVLSGSGRIQKKVFEEEQGAPTGGRRTTAATGRFEILHKQKIDPLRAPM